MHLDPSRRVLIYAEGAFGKGRSKTAEGVLRYGHNPVVGVVDSTRSERTVGEVLGGAPPSLVPLFPCLDDALAADPEVLLLGIAPPGGGLPEAWMADLAAALRRGMDLVSGLHTPLSEIRDLAEAARAGGASIWDVREPEGPFPIASRRAATLDETVVLAVGTDCAIGKMTVMLEIEREARGRGVGARFLATGQTGIMISGSGVPLDRVIGDFMAGAAEELVLSGAGSGDLLLVEGQGSLLHPGFSGVTLALMHGAAPSQMILVHEQRRITLRDDPVVIPPLTEMIALHQRIAGYIRPSKVVAVALNCAGLSDAEAEAALQQTEADTGLPTGDVFRGGAARLLSAIQSG